ncbi:hypothetical protein AUP68_17511 [Ilyonectria robusta]
MPSYPGLGLDLRYHVQNEARRNPLIIYPMGIHGNCFGSDSEMLLIREVAMMTIMDRLSDKPDFHVKVFDDAITEKWIDEALDFSAEKMHEEIIKGSDVHGEIGWDGRKPLKSILDRGCLDYVNALLPCVKPTHLTNIVTVHQGATCQSGIFQEDRLDSNTGCLRVDGQIGHRGGRIAAQCPPCCFLQVGGGPKGQSRLASPYQ